MENDFLNELQTNDLALDSELRILADEHGIELVKKIINTIGGSSFHVPMPCFFVNPMVRYFVKRGKITSQDLIKFGIGKEKRKKILRAINKNKTDG